MTNEEKVQHWIKIADNDLVVAQGMIEMKQNLYVGFMCQQATEKLIKGYFIKMKNDVHPHIHDLLKLAERAELLEMLNEEQIALLAELNPMYMEARYVEYKMRILEYLTDEKTKSILEKTKEFVQWMKEKM